MSTGGKGAGSLCMPLNTESRTTVGERKKDTEEGSTALETSVFH